MKHGGPIDFILIDLDPSDQQKLKDLITKQVAVGDLKSIGPRNEMSKIWNITWTKLKKVVMVGNS